MMICSGAVTLGSSSAGVLPTALLCGRAVATRGRAAIGARGGLKAGRAVSAGGCVAGRLSPGKFPKKAPAGVARLLAMRRVALAVAVRARIWLVMRTVADPLVWGDPTPVQATQSGPQLTSGSCLSRERNGSTDR